jgi:hypothetical protein
MIGAHCRGPNFALPDRDRWKECFAARGFDMLNRLKWLRNINGILYRLFSLVLLHKAAICQYLEKRRHSKRQNCHISVAVTQSQNTFSAVIRNINPFGARLDNVGNRLHIGDRITLHFALHYLEPPVETPARVVWCGHGSAGIEFESE